MDQFLAELRGIGSTQALKDAQVSLDAQVTAQGGQVLESSHFDYIPQGGGRCLCLQATIRVPWPQKVQGFAMIKVRG